MNQARHADCYQGDQEHPTVSVLGVTEERDTHMLVGAEPPEKRPCHDSLLLSTPCYSKTMKPLNQGLQGCSTQPHLERGHLSSTSHVAWVSVRPLTTQHLLSDPVHRLSTMCLCQRKTVQKVHHTIPLALSRGSTGMSLDLDIPYPSSAVSGHQHSSADLPHGATPSSTLSCTGDTEPGACHASQACLHPQPSYFLSL